MKFKLLLNEIGGVGHYDDEEQTVGWVKDHYKFQAKEIQKELVEKEIQREKYQHYFYKLRRQRGFSSADPFSAKVREEANLLKGLIADLNKEIENLTYQLEDLEA